MAGLVFDIQRNSLNDGPGIRTTVFLKGCPLNCLWCHNEESIDTKPLLRFYPDKCCHCMDCVRTCSVGAHLNANGIHKIDFKSCIQNKDCIEVCPSGALAITGEEMDIESILTILLKDRAYFKNSGGGLSISGGEPMLQFSFTKELLRRAKEEGIHTCLDISGYAPWEHLAELLPYTDIFLFDYKESDPEKHENFTGVDNVLILENLKKLNDSGANIILRCPIIPELNDRKEHFESIADLLKKHTSISEVHILPYHNMGIGKAHQHGLSTLQKEFRTPSEEEKNQWRTILNKNASDKIIIF